MNGVGRYAPSPSGDLHLGNLRTAVLAWLLARQSGRRFVLRIEDLDRVRPGAEERQLEDLADLGITFDGPALRQTDRVNAYEAALDDLRGRGLVYECYCTRREIQQAASAPHAPEGAYPGTCRDLTETQRTARRHAGRPAALRLRAEVSTFTVTDDLLGTYTGGVDDLVLRRTDGVPAYNLAVVVDDGFQAVDQVVRGDDLMTSAPRQGYLATLLGVDVPRYGHVPLALGPTGKRLAKRDGSVTLRDRRADGDSTADVIERIAASIGAPGVRDLRDLDRQWSPSMLPTDPWLVFGE